MLVRRVTLLVLSFCALSLYAVWAEETEAVSPVLSSQAVQALREAKTVRLVVNVSNPDYLSAAQAAKLCKRLLGYAGLQVVEAENAEADVEIVVEARLRALSATYSPFGVGGDSHWSGAEVDGSVRVLRHGAVQGAAMLYERTPCPGSIRSGAYGSPSDAPFERTFELAFVETLYVAAVKLWGPGPLMDFFRHTGTDVTELVKHGLWELGDAAVDPLIATLKDVDTCPFERRLAANMLGGLGEARALEPLIAAVEEGDKDLRQVAAKALGQLGDVRALEPLIAALEDEDHGVQRAAAQALGELGDARAMDPLTSALRDSSGVGWVWPTEALGKLGDARAVERVMVALKDKDWRVREAVAEALGKLGDAQAVEPLVAALKDKDGSVQKAVVEALGELGDVQAVEPLIGALKERTWWVRKAAAEALGKLGDPRAVKPLIAALKDRDVRGAAAKGLGKLGDARAVEPLINALKDGWRVRYSAARALKAITQRDLGTYQQRWKDWWEKSREAQ